MKSNPRHEHFSKVIAAGAGDLLGPWKGDCWRFQSVRFPAPEQILSGEGALASGGRWNGRGMFAAVYGSTDDTTAVRESGAVAAYTGFPMKEPRLLVAIRLELTRVLDMTNATMRRKLGVTLKEFREEDWRKIQDSGHESLSQALGRAALDGAAEAILVPSFAHYQGVNIAYFPTNRAKESKVSIWHEDQIKKLSRPEKRE